MTDNKLLIDVLNETIALEARAMESHRENNVRWEGVIKLIITLSSSLLAGTAALYSGSDLFFQDQGMSIWIISGWTFTFLSILSGVATILNEIVFHDILGLLLVVFDG